MEQTGSSLIKTCTKCKEQKHISDFYARKTSKDKLHSQCKKCAIEYVSKWKRNNPEKKDKQLLRFYCRKFGIDFNKVWELSEKKEVNGI